MRDILHHNNLIPKASLLNLSHYRMPSKDSEALKEKIEKLIHIGHNKESMNSFIRLPRTQKRVNFVEKYNKKCKAAADKKRRENFLKKKIR